ncbi:MAG: carbonic anhydrase [Terrisporobacter sp.]|uniref:beta-class carbonic anhydrase n=1 Tax=Terrisporobacter sp. TaxID=1965305 RepID=UPI002FCC2FAB
MRKLDQILEFNKEFVLNKEYEQFQTSKEPDKRILILSCMDTRLTKLLPKALNLKNGDAKIVKNAGATILHPFGSIMRSIVVAIFEFKVDEILIVGHDGCGMCNLDTQSILDKAIKSGISEETINILENSGRDVKKWLHGFDSVKESIEDSVEKVKNHPLVPSDIIVHGLVMSPHTGKVDVIVNGYEK